MRSRISLLALAFVTGVSSVAVAAPKEALQLFHDRMPTVAGHSAVLHAGDSDAKAESIARELITSRIAHAATTDLRLTRAISLRDGTRIVRLKQHHMGLPVVGTGASVTFGRDGVARVLGAQIASDLPSDVTPSIDEHAVARLASEYVRRPVSADEARLVIWQGGNGPFLAWVTYSQATAAFTGTRCRSRREVRRGGSSARCALVRSTSEGARSEPDQDARSHSGAARSTRSIDRLTNDLIYSRNCIDNHQTKQISFQGFDLTVHVCDLIQTATADANGDFFITPGAD
ncbi:MAG: hypothetical protein U0165_19605 [Polyangiaceae bacterium]